MTASARGLFRATGKTAKPVMVDLLCGEAVYADEPLREKDDFYPTPPEPTRALLRAEMQRLRDFPVIWEPACGDGAMVREIRAAGLNCFGTDLIQRTDGTDPDLWISDFFAEPICPRGAKAIITNPPYHLINERDGKGAWVWHAMETLKVDYMALLLSWSWPGAGGHARLWQEHPPARVYLMRWKIDFTGAGAPPMLNAWFVWDRQHKGETVLRMLDRNDDARQEVLL